MKKLKVHVLYEYGMNARPHASSSLRLLRPLNYPTVREQIDVSFGYDLEATTPDIVIVDRLWRPDIQPEMVHQLAEAVRRRGAKLSYWFDDNFLALEGIKPIAPHLLESFRAFLEAGDSYVVTSQPLKDAYSSKNKVLLLPSALDERIIVRKLEPPAAGGPLVIGYMGSTTHEEDLALALSALRAIHARFAESVRFEMIGVVPPQKQNAWLAEAQLPVRILAPMPAESEYPLFMLWFTGSVCWDLAIAPLVDNRFNPYKSDIKFLDYSAAGVPGIYSRVACYTGTVEHEQTGLIVDNDAQSWVSAIERLVGDVALRQSIRENADAYLYQHRTLARCAGNWVTTLQALRD